MLSSCNEALAAFIERIQVRVFQLPQPIRLPGKNFQLAEECLKEQSYQKKSLVAVKDTSRVSDDLRTCSRLVCRLVSRLGRGL